MQTSADRLAGFCPAGILFAVGEFDPNLIFTPGGAEDLIKRLRKEGGHPDTELKVMEATGHASPKTNPNQVATVVVEFLRRKGLLPHLGAPRL